MGLVTTDMPGWPCPVKAVLGVPCPGCALSTAVVPLVRGIWSYALRDHAFAPLFLLRIMTLERRIGIVAFLLLGVIVYWVLRLNRLS